MPLGVILGATIVLPAQRIGTDLLIDDVGPTEAYCGQWRIGNWAARLTGWWQARIPLRPPARHVGTTYRLPFSFGSLFDLRRAPDVAN